MYWSSIPLRVSVSRSFVRAAQEVLLVVCDEPTSITDAYALIKLLNRDYGMNRFRVLANMARASGRAQPVCQADQGHRPFPGCRPAVRRRRALRRVRAQGGAEAACRVRSFPRSKCALAFKAIAQKVDSWPLPANPRGHLEFFVERLVQPTSAGPVL